MRQKLPFLPFFHSTRIEKFLIKKIKTAAILLVTIILSYNGSAQVIQSKTVIVTGHLIKVIPSLKDFKPDHSLLVERKGVAVDDILEEAEHKIRKKDYNHHNVPDPVVQRTTFPGTVMPLQNQANISANIPLINPANTPSTANSQPTAALNFDGMGLPVATLTPADPNMCAGPNHIIQMINGSAGAYFQIWNRNGVPLIPPTYMDALAGAAYVGNGDPIALYDQFSNRFIITEFRGS